MSRLRRHCATYHARSLPPALQAELNSSQQKVEGFDLVAYQAANILLVGAGGIGSHVASALLRKGIGGLWLADDDVVECKNLTRQLFSKSDLANFKAVALARQLARDGLFPAEIRALPFRFQELLANGHDIGRCNLIVCGVDNNPTRRAVSAYALQHNMVVIYAAVARDGNSLYVMLQSPGAACWGCVFPTYLNDDAYPCGLPGIIDVLQVVSGLIVYTVDTVLCGRSREWNVRQMYLDGSLPDRARSVLRRRGCALCTGHTIWAA